ncbi:putative ASC1-like protein 3 [Cocos nucifera]|uniref:Putative ASC1-like protein 3 n=1 Tax=Cocos nucifera TaxID=13894 RepID=A0A8K0I4Y7_COCNU|nr:putative ASC1-like protein 3 [Cocos nucifera]
MGPIWGLTRGDLDLLIVLYFAVWFLGARFLLDRLVHKPLAIRLLRASLINDEARQSKMGKCSESMWKLTYYVSVQPWVPSIIKQPSVQKFSIWRNYATNFCRSKC